MKALSNLIPIACAAVAASLSVASAQDAGSAQDLKSLLPQKIRDAGVLRIGGPTTIPPYLFMDRSGAFTGINHELMTALAEKFGVQVEFNNINYSALIPAIQADRVDAGMGTFTDTLAREEQLDFVNYITTRMVLMGHKDNAELDIETVDDMCGRSAAAPSGTTAEVVFAAQNEKCKAEGRPELTLLLVPSPPEAQLQVENGRVDVFIQAFGVGRFLETSNPNFVIVGQSFRPEYHGVGVIKGNQELVDALMAGFEAIMADGTYAAVLDKYKVSELGLERPVVNGATHAPLEE